MALQKKDNTYKVQYTSRGHLAFRTSLYSIFNTSYRPSQSIHNAIDMEYTVGDEQSSDIWGQH